MQIAADGATRRCGGFGLRCWALLFGYGIIFDLQFAAQLPLRLTNFQSILTVRSAINEQRTVKGEGGAGMASGMWSRCPGTRQCQKVLTGQ